MLHFCAREGKPVLAVYRSKCPLKKGVSFGSKTGATMIFPDITIPHGQIAPVGVEHLFINELLEPKNARLETGAEPASPAARAAVERAGAHLPDWILHDLKSPLIALNTTSKMLEDAAEDPAEVRALARLMAGEARRMSRLVNDFIDRSSIDEGSLRLAKKAFDLPFLAAGVLDEHRSAAEAKRHTLALLPPSAHPAQAVADPARVEQILGNLIENAVKHTPCGGRITLAFGETPDAVWCTVEDNGPGLTLADLTRILHPYQKLSARPAAGESSHGLALARELARLQGGHIAAGNVPGAGARFLLTLPRA